MPFLINAVHRYILFYFAGVSSFRQDDMRNYTKVKCLNWKLDSFDKKAYLRLYWCVYYIALIYGLISLTVMGYLKYM